jgi:hypothetical protein
MIAAKLKARAIRRTRLSEGLEEDFFWPSDLKPLASPLRVLFFLGFFRFETLKLPSSSSPASSKKRGLEELLLRRKESFAKKKATIVPKVKEEELVKFCFFSVGLSLSKRR